MFALLPLRKLSSQNQTNPTMSETTYFIEHAKSARGKCKKCKETIAKGELRIATSELL